MSSTAPYCAGSCGRQMLTGGWLAIIGSRTKDVTDYRTEMKSTVGYVVCPECEDGKLAQVMESVVDEETFRLDYPMQLLELLWQRLEGTAEKE
jgi:hypothetical protein